jgi:LuxR family maltose regulon positive regulatory protein
VVRPTRRRWRCRSASGSRWCCAICLSSRLSAGEIADELYVSLNTVKTHIKSIYRKLDTNRRWDAVKRARQLQLL